MIREVLLIEFHASLKFLRDHHHHHATLIPNITIENRIYPIELPLSTLKIQEEQFKTLFMNKNIHKDDYLYPLIFLLIQIFLMTTNLLIKPLISLLTAKIMIDLMERDS